MKSRRPEPYLIVEQCGLYVKSIFDADVYYDVTDNETYLVIRIMTLNNKHQTGTWIRASSLFKHDCKGQASVRIQQHNFELFSQWFNDNKKEAESMHPILKEAWRQYVFEQYEPEYNHSYIEGFDTKHYRKWSVMHLSDSPMKRKGGEWHLATQPSS